LDTVTQNVVVKDLLVVALGDSYGAGEGSPDAPQVIHYDILGQPLVIEQPARWWDERCHRSMFAPSARAAWMVEKANPQVSVTYISFACSGATINRYSTDGADPLNPYGIPSQGAHNVGAGILAPYSGAVPP